MNRTDPPSQELETDRAHPARVYDYFLGGKDNFTADRELGELIIATTPEMRDSAHGNRAFMQRAVRHVAEHGVAQFLDLGTGIPTSPNTHEIAQAVTPDARVVYVDNDPIVSVHGRALLATDATTALIQHDITEIDTLLEDPSLRQLIDFAQPVGIMFLASLHYVAEAADPVGIVRGLLDLAAPGSYLILSHFTGDLDPRAFDVAELAAQIGETMVPRSREQVEEFFAGLDVEEPGIVQPTLWRPEGPPAFDHGKMWGFAGVGRKR